MSAAVAAEADALSIIPLEGNDWLSEPITAIRDIEDGGDVQMAVWGDNVYAVWMGREGVVFAKSSDNGSTFSKPISLTKWNPDSSVGLNPTVMAYNDNVYVLYSSGKDIFLVRSQNGGESFGEPLNVSRTKIGSPALVVTDHVMSIAGDMLYVAWTVSNFSWSEIYFAQSSDGGKTFGEPKNVSDSPSQPSQLPRIASSGSQIYLAWYDIDEYYVVNHVSFAGSNDGGITFSRINNLSGNSQPYSAYEHGVAIGKDGVYVTWREEREDSPTIVLAKSIDYGKTFDDVKDVAHGAWPALAVAGDNVYIAFGVQENGTDNVGFVSSLDGGKTFSDAIMLSNHTWGLNPYDDRPFPKISADGANVFVAWRYTAGAGEESNHETFFAASYDEGWTFTSQLNISQSKLGDTARQPALLASPIDRVFVLWEEYIGNRTAMMAVRGQIPEVYTEPFREVSYMTPVKPYDPVIFTITAGASIAAVAGGAFYYLYKKRSKK